MHTITTNGNQKSTTNQNKSREKPRWNDQFHIKELAEDRVIFEGELYVVEGDHDLQLGLVFELLQLHLLQGLHDVVGDERVDDDAKLSGRGLGQNVLFGHELVELLQFGVRDPVPALFVVVDE